MYYKLKCIIFFFFRVFKFYVKECNLKVFVKKKKIIILCVFLEFVKFVIFLLKVWFWFWIFICFKYGEGVVFIFYDECFVVCVFCVLIIVCFNVNILYVSFFCWRRKYCKWFIFYLGYWRRIWVFRIWFNFW